MSPEKFLSVITCYILWVSNTSQMLSQQNETAQVLETPTLCNLARQMKLHQLSSLDLALFQAALDPQSNIGRDEIAELVNVLALEGEIIASRCLDDILIETEIGLRS